ncbi:MAG TPA: hypothetical protein VGS20_04265 [Candidatus Acidoferrales bacterium]|nr:hypothetical protein [Candidatus Acidoferrales bacterium]
MAAFRLLWRAARQLFHETTGAMFFVFSAAGGFTALRQWRNPAARWVAWLGVIYALMMAAFGVGAFRDARRIRRAHARW